MTVYEPSCAVVGVDPKKIASVARRLESVSRDAARMGLYIFGGAGSGSLRANTMTGPVVVAVISSDNWDGGDGGTSEDEAGVMRGER